ncbi:MAG: c-type cytochrome, partial [Planctomycetales bacterium]
PQDVRDAALSLLVSRRDWTLRLLDAVAAKKIDSKTISIDVVWRIQLHPGDQIVSRVGKIWGSIKNASNAQLKQRVEHFAAALEKGSGDPYQGKKLFTTSCSKCHTLFKEGGKIGPDLTAYKRDEVTTMLLHIVNPSAEIREGFETHVALTRDGRTVMGFLVDKDNQIVTLRGQDGQNVTLNQDQIEEMIPQRKSLMPEGLLKNLGDEQIRDLFAYLRSSQPLNE